MAYNPFRPIISNPGTSILVAAAGYAVLVLLFPAALPVAHAYAMQLTGVFSTAYAANAAYGLLAIAGLYALGGLTSVAAIKTPEVVRTNVTNARDGGIGWGVFLLKTSYDSALAKKIAVASGAMLTGLAYMVQSVGAFFVSLFSKTAATASLYNTAATFAAAGTVQMGVVTLAVVAASAVALYCAYNVLYLVSQQLSSVGISESAEYEAALRAARSAARPPVAELAANAPAHASVRSAVLPAYEAAAGAAAAAAGAGVRQYSGEQPDGGSATARAWSPRRRSGSGSGSED